MSSRALRFCLPLVCGLALGAVHGVGCSSEQCSGPSQRVERGRYDITASTTPGFESGTVDVADENVTIAYQDEDGSSWTVVYDVVAESPEP